MVTTVKTEAALSCVCAAVRSGQLGLPVPCVISDAARNVEIFFQALDKRRRRRIERVAGSRGEIVMQHLHAFLIPVLTREHVLMSETGAT